MKKVKGINYYNLCYNKGQLVLDWDSLIRWKYSSFIDSNCDLLKCIKELSLICRYLWFVLLVIFHYIFFSYKLSCLFVAIYSYYDKLLMEIYPSV